MITYISGLPGAGKTLFTLVTVEAIRKETGRQVFSCGMLPDGTSPQINELSLEWEHLANPQEWEKCPPNSIVVIDEAQFLFPTRSHKIKAAEFIERLAVHRHSGIDLYLITQDPMNTDHFVRRLSGRHIHIERKFGTERSRVFEWPTVQKQSDYFARKQAINTWFKFPKHAFAWYRSAEAHTVKSSFPWLKVVGLGAMVVALVGIVVGTIAFVTNWDSRAIQHTADNSLTDGELLAGGREFRRPSSRVPWENGELVARLPGFAHTAPYYDSLMDPVTFPRIVGCSSYEFSDRGSVCECYSQQGTVLNVTPRQCQGIMRKGWFDFTREDVALQQRSNVQTQPLAQGVPGADSFLAPQAR